MDFTRRMQRFEGERNRELRAYGLYRAFAAVLMTAVVLGLGTAWLGESDAPRFAAWACVLYLAAAIGLLMLTRTRVRVATQVSLGTLLDLFFANLVVLYMPGATPVVAIMLIVNVAASGWLLSLPFAMTVAVLASITFLAQTFAQYWSDGVPAQRPLLEPLVFSGSYFAVAYLAHTMGRRLAESAQVAARRGLELADLSVVNEVIIHRMPTGVLIVDAQGRVELENAAATALLGRSAQEAGTLSGAAPALAQRLAQWRASPQVQQTPVRLGPENAEILPQFRSLHAGGEEVLVFLDDTSQVARRAEDITLAALGRFSASLAHELRNPLSAVGHSAQLLEESPDLTAPDRELVRVVRQQSLRMNGIVESVLGLARGRTAVPRTFDLCALAREFADEYRRSYPLDDDTLDVQTLNEPAWAEADPRQVHQIVLVLVANARYYGRQPGAPARIRLEVGDTGQPWIAVTDAGPGVADEDATQLFRPFFTTSHHGTGLGLHVARELARANQGELELVPTVTGACFRLSLPPAAE